MVTEVTQRVIDTGGSREPPYPFHCWPVIRHAERGYRVGYTGWWVPDTVLPCPGTCPGTHPAWYTQWYTRWPTSSLITDWSYVHLGPTTRVRDGTVRVVMDFLP